MKFVCLVYFEPQAFAALSPGEKAAIGRDSMAYDKELDRTGHYVIAEALDPVSTARTVQVRHGKAKVVDGPFAEPRNIWADSSASMQRTWTRRSISLRKFPWRRSAASRYGR
jgi:hypothetical protein